MSVIGIVGAGQLGTVLAKRLVAAGHVVNIANSRGLDSLRSVEVLTGAKAVHIGDVAVRADVLILAVPLRSVPNLSGKLAASPISQTIIVDAGNYVPLRDGAIAEIDEGIPESMWVSRVLGTPVVKAFNSISDISLEHGGLPKGVQSRIALPVAGDDPNARFVVMRLVEQLGFDALDAGPLSDSWRQQLGQPAYCTDGSLKQLTSLLGRAKRETVRTKREETMKLMSKLSPDFPKSTLLKAGRFMAGLDRAKLGNWLAVGRVAMVMMRRT